MARYLDLGLRILGACLLLALLLILFIVLAPALGIVSEGSTDAEFIYATLPVLTMLLLVFSPFILVFSMWAEIFKAKNDKTWKIIWFAASLLMFLSSLLGFLGIGAYYFIGRKEMKE